MQLLYYTGGAGGRWSVCVKETHILWLTIQMVHTVSLTIHTLWHTTQLAYTQTIVRPRTHHKLKLWSKQLKNVYCTHYVRALVEKSGTHMYTSQQKTALVNLILSCCLHSLYITITNLPPSLSLIPIVVVVLTSPNISNGGPPL